MDYQGPIANYMPFLLSAFVLSIAAVGGFYGWLATSRYRLRKLLDVMKD